MSGGPQLCTMMPEVSDGISEQVFEAHLSPKAGIPPGGIAHRHIPMVRLEALNPREQSAVHLVEFTDDSVTSKPPCSYPRADCIDLVKERRGEIEDTCEDPSADDGKLTKEDKDSSQGPNEYKAQ